VSLRNGHGQPVGDPVPGWRSRPRPIPVTVSGRYATLEPIDGAHTDALHAALCGPDDASLWTYRSDEMPVDRKATAERVRELADPADWVTFVIVPTGGAASGIASLTRIDATQGSVEVGGVLYARDLQRTRAATEAAYLLMSHVFDALGYRRYEWKLDALNAPSAAAARRLGFGYEGRFRQAMVYKGRNRDTDWFAMTDADFARLRPAYDAWLDPANFGVDGQQRRSLSSLTAGLVAG